MTDKERLEMIASKHSDLLPFALGISVDRDDYIWLAKQARKNITCQEVVELQGDMLKGLLKQNKRYQKAIKKAIGEFNYDNHQEGMSELLKALEESE